jgi:hypothetical protein
MAVDPKLLDAIERKTGLSRSQVNRRISDEMRTRHLPRRIAAISLASQLRLPLTRFASDDDLAQLRGVAPARNIEAAPTPEAMPLKPVARPGKTRIKPTKDNSMFVVHGRDAALNRDMYAFLSSIGIGDVIKQAMEKVQGVMVLFSPDEEAKLTSKLATDGDKRKNLHLKGFQPRPNVILEAGLALGAHSDKTILVEVGNVREISDIAGKHLVHLSNSFAARKRLADRLESKLRFKIDLTGTTWQEIGNFDR